jgi:hypothetical protein
MARGPFSTKRILEYSRGYFLSVSDRNIPAQIAASPLVFLIYLAALSSLELYFEAVGLTVCVAGAGLGVATPAPSIILVG